MQDKIRREQLEKMRETANMDASKGEVRPPRPLRGSVTAACRL